MGGVALGGGCIRSRLGRGRSAMFSLLGFDRRFCSMDGRGLDPSREPSGGVPWGKLRGDGGTRSSGRPGGPPRAASLMLGMDGGPGRRSRCDPSEVGGRPGPRGGGRFLPSGVFTLRGSPGDEAPGGSGDLGPPRFALDSSQALRTSTYGPGSSEGGGSRL